MKHRFPIKKQGHYVIRLPSNGIDRSFAHIKLVSKNSSIMPAVSAEYGVFVTNRFHFDRKMQSQSLKMKLSWNRISFIEIKMDFFLCFLDAILQPNFWSTQSFTAPTNQCTIIHSLHNLPHGVCRWKYSIHCEKIFFFSKKKLHCNTPYYFGSQLILFKFFFWFLFSFRL